MSDKNCQALEGVRVLDLTQYEAGPTCTLFLAFLGAEVIKIENPAQAESCRHLFYGKGANEDLYFVLLNLNKKSITLDINTDEGRSIFIELVKRSDVLVENFGGNKMERLGFGPDQLRESNPRLIYASLSGYGSYGPYASYPSMDMTAQAMGGVMSVTGDEDDPPLRCGAAIADSSGGANLALGIVAALYQRERTKKGMKVEVSLHDSVVNLGRSILGAYIAYGSRMPKLGNRLKDVVPWNIYKTVDGGYVAICVIQQHLFERLMNIIGKGELIKEFDLTSLRRRKEERKLIEKAIGEWILKRNKHDVMKRLCEQDIPCGAVLDSIEVSRDPHLKEREMIVEIEHHQWGRIKVLGCPVKFLDSKMEVRSSPCLGGHNREIFSGLLGMSEAEIQHLKEKGIV